VRVNGFVVVDDYGAIRNCLEAVDDFRAQNKIDAELTNIDWTCVLAEALTCVSEPRLSRSDHDELSV